MFKRTFLRGLALTDHFHLLPLQKIPQEARAQHGSCQAKADRSLKAMRDKSPVQVEVCEGHEHGGLH